MPNRSQLCRGRLGLPLPAIVGLAALAVPRAVVHDLDLAGPAVNAALALGPLAVWLGAAWWSRLPRQMSMFLALGALYGLLLAATHQILWDRAAGDSPPGLGGALHDLPAGAHEAITRVGAAVSSLVTGIAVGALVGLVALAAKRIRERHDGRVGHSGRLR